MPLRSSSRGLSRASRGGDDDRDLPVHIGAGGRGMRGGEAHGDIVTDIGGGLSIASPAKATRVALGSGAGAFSGLAYAHATIPESPEELRATVRWSLARPASRRFARVIVTDNNHVVVLPYVQSRDAPFVLYRNEDAKVTHILVFGEEQDPVAYIDGSADKEMSAPTVDRREDAPQPGGVRYRQLFKTSTRTYVDAYGTEFPRVPIAMQLRVDADEKPVVESAKRTFGHAFVSFDGACTDNNTYECSKFVVAAHGASFTQADAITMTLHTPDGQVVEWVWDKTGMHGPVASTAARMGSAGGLGVEFAGAKAAVKTVLGTAEAVVSDKLHHAWTSLKEKLSGHRLLGEEVANAARHAKAALEVATLEERIPVNVDMAEAKAAVMGSGRGRDFDRRVANTDRPRARSQSIPRPHIRR